MLILTLSHRLNNRSAGALGLTNKYKLNGAVIPSSTNVASYFMEGVYQPCVFNKLSIDSGIVIVYKK